MRVAGALADAAIEAALVAPNAYLPSVRVQVAYAQRMVHRLMAWAERQEQSLEALARGGALKAAALALGPPLPDDYIVGRIHDYTAAMDLVEKKLLKREQETSPYRCTECGATGVKLWRQYQTFVEHIKLLCVTCAERDQKREWKPAKSDQIGWLVPAVPTIDGETYWGYTSVPAEGANWWKSLADRRVANGKDRR